MIRVNDRGTYVLIKDRFGQKRYLAKYPPMTCESKRQILASRRVCTRASEAENYRERVLDRLETLRKARNDEDQSDHAS